jgi:hypothetical protein
MPRVAVDMDALWDLLRRRDDLVRAITAGMTSGDWDQVMAPFDALLVAIKRLEEGVGEEGGWREGEAGGTLGG